MSNSPAASSSAARKRGTSAASNPVATGAGRARWGRDAAELPLIIKSLQAWTGMQRRVGQDVGFRCTGATHACRTQRQLDEYESWILLVREYEIPTTMLAKAK